MADERRPSVHSQRPEGPLAWCAQNHEARARRPVSAARRNIANDPRVCSCGVLSTAEWSMSAAHRNIANNPKVCSNSVPSTAEPVPGGQ
jgi:hypothetical protein